MEAKRDYYTGTQSNMFGVLQEKISHTYTCRQRERERVNHVMTLERKVICQPRRKIPEETNQFHLNLGLPASETAREDAALLEPSLQCYVKVVTEDWVGLSLFVPE